MLVYPPQLLKTIKNQVFYVFYNQYCRCVFISQPSFLTDFTNSPRWAPRRNLDMFRLLSVLKLIYFRDFSKSVCYFRGARCIIKIKSTIKKGQDGWGIRGPASFFLLLTATWHPLSARWLAIVFFVWKNKNTSGALMGDTKNHPEVPFCLDCSVLKGQKSRRGGGGLSFSCRLVGYRVSIVTKSKIITKHYGRSGDNFTWEYIEILPI